MEAFEAEIKREEAVRALLPLFFVSGATGLVYQTIWARQLELVFGTSTFAISTVLSAFMAGLAIGGFVAGRRADRVPDPLRAYGLLEIGVGVYAVVFPLVVQAVTPLYLGFWRAFHPGVVGYGVAQSVLVGAALLVPTTLMGATLPLLARFATDRVGAAGDRVGLLYGVNTAGAVFGTWLCGFWLLPMLGLSLTTWLAAATNVLLGVGAMVVAARAKGWEQAPVPADVPEVDLGPTLRTVVVAAGLAGLASLIYEVAWTRLLVLMLGASVYAFSVMLLAFLVGIAVGGRAGGPLADRWLAKHGPSGVLLAFAGIEIGVGVASWLLMWIFPELPFWYVWLFDAFGAIDHPSWVWPVSLMIAFVVMTPPAVLMGAAFPVAVRAVIGHREELGGPVGQVYGANTLGGMIGAATAGFLLLPHLGVQGTVFVGAGVNLLAAGVLASRSGSPRRLTWLAVAVALTPFLGGFLLRPPWNPLLMTAGMYKYVSETENHSREAIYRYAVERYELLYYAEGLSSVVTVARNPETGNIWLANNGKVDASTSLDMPTQILVALLPFQFVHEPKDALVVGLASGITAGAVTQVASLDRIDVVELEPRIEGAAKLFADHNHHVLDDPRVHLIANDGRNHVLLTAPETYDVIVNEPSNPWISGVSNLFTKEFLEMGKRRLKPGGVWSQWVQMYGMDEEDLRSLLATYASVYKYVLVYATIEEADLVVVGSDEPIAPTEDAAASLMASSPTAKAELARIKMTEPDDLVGVFLMDRDAITAFAGDISLNTDDNMRVEYSAPLNLHRNTSAANMERLLEVAQIPTAGVKGDPVELAKLARNYIHRDDFDRSLKAMALAIDAIVAESPDAPVHDVGKLVADLHEKAKWADAIHAMEGDVDYAMAQPQPPDAFLEEWAGWKDDLATWAADDDE